MKIHKKISFGLVLITGLFAGLFFAQTSSAAPSFSAAWIDRSNILVTGEGKTIILNDRQWDDDWEYVGSVDGCPNTLSGGLFSGEDLITVINGFDPNLIVGFGKDSTGHPNKNPWSDSLSKADKFSLNYKASPTDTSCTKYPLDGHVPISIENSRNAQIAYRWTDDSHNSITRVDDSDNWVFSDPEPVASTGKTRFFRQSDPGGNDKCRDVIDVSADKSTMWLYEQTDNKGASSGKQSPLDKSCWLFATIDNVRSGNATVSVWNYNIPSDYAIPLEEADAVPQPPGTPTEPGSVTGDDEACYSKGWELSWIACPVITAAQTAANAMYGFVEDQLKFTVSQNGSKDSLGDQHENVKKAWNNFRILVSGLVVILMLVMVISQAIGSGPFDAYTVRKMLPRLVMGVILIQISWPLFSWVVNTVDDLGRGIADLMYAPFCGSEALNLNTIMSDFKTEGTVFSWVGIPALLIFGVVAPFIALGMILTVLVALLAGFLTLLFRKIIIILALIFVPLALISWMMPNDGLRKYWKLWWDNFIKALMMFPLIIAIIAAGRIFAKIGSAQIDFVGFFIVLVGFFGPLFILPKTFKWGGTVMTMAGNAMQKAQTATLKKPREFLGERQKGYSAERTFQSQERYSRNEGFNWRRPWRRPIDLVKSGQIDPTLWGRRRQRAMDTYFEKGEKTTQEDVSAAEAKLIRERQAHRARGGQHDLYLQAIASGLESYHDPNLNETIPLGRRSGAERMAARKQLAKLGAGMNWRYLSNYHESSRRALDDARRTGNQGQIREAEQNSAEMRKFFDDNVDLILPKLPSIYKSIGQAADVNAEGLAQMHGVEVENIIAALTQRIEQGAAPGATAQQQQAGTDAQGTLVKFLQTYQEAAANNQTRGGLELGGRRAVRAFLTNNQGNLDQYINTDGDGVNGRLAPNRAEVMPGEGARILRPLEVSGVIDQAVQANPTIANNPDVQTFMQDLNVLRNNLGNMINDAGSFTIGGGAETEVRIDHARPASGWSAGPEYPPEPIEPPERPPS